jgi:predicted amidohydrolase YtcJ
VEAWAHDHPDDDVLWGRGWQPGYFLPDGPRKEDLDRIRDDIPIVLIHWGGDEVWLNSVALERVGFTREATDPPGGQVVRDPASGEPTGAARGLGALVPVFRNLPNFTVEQYMDVFRAFQREHNAYGITTVRFVSALYRGANPLRALQRLAEQGELTMRYTLSAFLYWDEPVEDQLAVIDAERDRLAGTLCSIRGTKIFLDGGIESQTAYLKEPYANRAGYRGLAYWSPEQLNAAVVGSHAHGYQTHIHAIGDAAVTMAVDTLAHACAHGPAGDWRDEITHFQVLDPADIPRMAELGVIACAQPGFAIVWDEHVNTYLPLLGPDRGPHIWPIRSLIDAGITVTGSSDFPCLLPADTVRQIEMGVTRQQVVGYGRYSHETLWPEERCTVEQMIAAYTHNGAYAHYLDGELGKLEPGKLADLVVLAEDITSVPPKEITRRGQVRLTVLEGREVYRSPALVT